MAANKKITELDSAGTLSGSEIIPVVDESNLTRRTTAQQIADLAGGPFDVTVFYPGLPDAAAIALRVPVARAVTFPADFSGSYGRASAAATGSAAFDVTKNGTTIGTVTFGAGQSTATFTTAGNAVQTLAAGDVLAITCPGSADASLADVGIVLAGTR